MDKNTNKARNNPKNKTKPLPAQPRLRSKGERAHFAGGVSPAKVTPRVVGRNFVIFDKETRARALKSPRAPRSTYLKIDILAPSLREQPTLSFACFARPSPKRGAKAVLQSAQDSRLFLFEGRGRGERCFFLFLLSKRTFSPEPDPQSEMVQVRALVKSAKHPVGACSLQVSEHLAHNVA